MTPDEQPGEEQGTTSPFRGEEAAQQDTMAPDWDPWKGPAPPHWYSGLGASEDYAWYNPINLGAGLAREAVTIPGSTAASGELLLAGAARQVTHLQGDEFSRMLMPDILPKLTPQETQEQQQQMDNFEADARMRLRALRPDPNTSGVAVQTLHSLGETFGKFAYGSVLAGAPGAFTALAGTTGVESYGDLRASGVDEATATEISAFRATLAGAGGVMPMVFGAGLATKLLTGAASNVGFGMVGREADSALLRANGYTAMADQQQVFDRTQMLIDLALGLGFGGFSHVTEAARPAMLKTAELMKSDPELRDAALTANLALRDRDASPGAPVDPHAANAHAAALEKAVQDLQDNQHVNVADTGITEASFLGRPGHENPAVEEILANALREQGVFEHQGKLEELEAALEHRLAGVPDSERTRPPAPSDRPANPIDPNGSDAEKLEQIHALTDENLPRVQNMVKDLNESLPETSSHESIKTDESIIGKANRPSILAKRPWWGMEHLADTLRFKTVVQSLHDVPKVMQTLAKHGVDVVKFDREKLEAPNSWGWQVLPTDLRMPNGQLVEHYIVGKHLNDAQAKEGHALFDKWRYRDEKQLTPKEFAEFHRDRSRSFKLYQRAWAADFERPGENLTDARASLDKAEALARSMTAARSGSVSIPGGKTSVQEPSAPLVAKKPSAPTTAGAEPSRSESTKSSLKTVSSIQPPSEIVRENARQDEQNLTDTAQAHAALADHPDLTVPNPKGAGRQPESEFVAQRQDTLGKLEEKLVAAPDAVSRHVALLDYLEKFVAEKRRTSPHPYYESAHFSGRDMDTDRGVARYVEKYKEELPDSVMRALHDENVMDLETGETHNAFDELHGGHIGQLRRLRDEVEIGLHDEEVNARAALQTVNETVARTQAEAPTLFKAAVDCFSRFGA